MFGDNSGDCARTRRPDPTSSRSVRWRPVPVELFDCGRWFRPAVWPAEWSWACGSPLVALLPEESAPRRGYDANSQSFFTSRSLSSADAASWAGFPGSGGFAVPPRVTYTGARRLKSAIIFHAHFRFSPDRAGRMLVVRPHRAVAQLVEQRSPKPQVAGSSPVRPAVRPIDIGRQSGR